MRNNKNFLTICAAMLVLGGIVATQPSAAGTLGSVHDRGILRCGVINSGIGLSEIDKMGHGRGFFPEFCRALAAAILGNADAVEFVEVNYVLRFEALNSNEFDVLMANTTWTTERDAALDLAFTHPLFYDGQGFLAHDALGARSLADVDRATVCVSEGTTTIQNLRELIAKGRDGLEIVAFQSVDQVYASFFSRECDLLTQDRVALVSQLLNRASDPDAFVLFPDVISKEPLGPVVRGNDQEWFDAVQWIIYATMIAEEHGINRTTVSSYLDSDVPEIRRLLGLDPGMGAVLGLPENWALKTLQQVGSYRDIYERTLGMGSSMRLERGLNALWVDGGLMYPPPMR